MRAKTHATAMLRQLHIPPNVSGNIHNKSILDEMDFEIKALAIIYCTNDHHDDFSSHIIINQP